MPNNVMYIAFVEPIPIGGSVSFKLDGINHEEEAVLSRSGSGEFTAGATVEATVANLKAALELDYGDEIYFEINSNTLTFISKNLALAFSDGESTAEVGVSYTQSGAITVTGLTGSNYLINNEITLNLNSGVLVNYYIITLENITNGNTTSPIKIYTRIGTNEKNVNLSPIIKSIFSYPEANQSYAGFGSTTKNLNTIRITVETDTGFFPYTITRNFIRGGNRTNDVNQVLPITVPTNSATWLQPASRIPAWNGYPIAGYRLNSAGSITKVLQGVLPTGTLDYQRVRGCNSIYIKFLNQKGGYSYWLFETNKETESNDNLGGFIRNNLVDDLGNDSNSSLSVWGKIPKAYIGLIKDLIISPEIYTYDGSKFNRLLSGKNSITIDDNKRAYQVTIKFELEYRFDPSLLWYN